MKKLFILLMPLFLFLAACSEPSDSKNYTPSVSYTDSFTQKMNLSSPTTWSYNLVVDYVITKCKPNARYEVTICYSSNYELKFYALADNNGNITGSKTVNKNLYAEPTSGVDSFTLCLSE